MSDNPIALALRARPAPTLPETELRTPPPERFTRRGLSLRAAPPDTNRVTTRLEDIPTMLMQAATTYLAEPNPSHMLLWAVPAGAGKTTAAVQLAEQLAAAGRRVLYAGPRRDFYSDVHALAGQPRWWYAWRPRTAGDPENQLAEPATCRWAAQMDQWLHRGYDAMSFCANPRICGWERVKGPKACPYHAQRENTSPIVFGQHGHVALGHPLMETFSLVIGDELPMSAFLHPWRIPLMDIVPPGIEDDELATLLRNLKWLCVQAPEPGQQWAGADLYRALPGGPRAVLAVCERYRLDVAAAAYTPELRTAASAEEAPYFHLPNLLGLLRREAERVAQGLDVIGRVRCTVDGLILYLKHTPSNLPAHVIWCDATGNAHLYQALFGRPVQVVSSDIALTGRVYQVWHSTNNRGAVLDDRPDVSGQPRGLAKQQQLRTQIDHVITTRGYQNPAIISYKALADGLLPGAESSHFGGNRGTNRLATCDALFVVGAPLPTHAAIQEIASMVYFDRDDPWRGEWHAKDVPFPGQPAAYSVGNFWDDPDLSALVMQLREAELIQAVHRARPLRRAVDVWLLTNVVVDLPVQLLSLHELMGAVSRDGTPLQGVDVLRWPAVLALPASEADPITAARLMDAFQVSKPTATAWLRALATCHGYTEITLDRVGQRGPKTRAVVKHLDVPK